MQEEEKNTTYTYCKALYQIITWQPASEIKFFCSSNKMVLSHGIKSWPNFWRKSLYGSREAATSAKYV